MAQILVDENVPMSVMEWLKSRGFSVQRVSEIGHTFYVLHLKEFNLSVIPQVIRFNREIEPLFVWWSV